MAGGAIPSKWKVDDISTARGRGELLGSFRSFFTSGPSSPRPGRSANPGRWWLGRGTAKHQMPWAISAERLCRTEGTWALAAGYGRRTTAPHAPREQRAPPRPPAVYVIWRAMEPLTVPPALGPQRITRRALALRCWLLETMASIRDSSPLWTGRWKWAEPRWTGCPRRPRWEAVGIVGCKTCLG